MIVQRLLIAAALAFAAALPYLGWLPGWTPALATVTAFGTVSLIGLNLIYGVTGMLALGQAAFVAIPGYASGIMEKFGVSAFVSIPLGVVFAALVARLVAEIFIRLPGIYFAIGTLGFAFVVEGLARAFPSVTGGASGLVLEAPFPLRRDGWYMVALAALAVSIASFAWLVRGRLLRTLKLVRHDELAAQVMGVDVVRIKANVFTIGSAYSAVGGILLAYYVAVLAPEAGGVNASLESLAMLIIGGSGSLFGPLLGAGAIQWLFAISARADRYDCWSTGSPSFASFFTRRPDRRRTARGMEARVRQSCAQIPPKAVSTASAELKITETGVQRAGICLQVENVAKNFGGSRAVQDVSSTSVWSDRCIDWAQWSGEIDPIQHHSGIETPTQDASYFAAKTCSASHPSPRRRHRSFVSGPASCPGPHLLENVVARLDHLPDAPGERVAQGIARAQLEVFGLSHFADVPTCEIGLGHHKLIELVRASVGGPALLLLVEPPADLHR